MLRHVLVVATSVVLLGSAQAAPQMAQAGDTATFSAAVVDDARQLSFGGQRFDPPTSAKNFRAGAKSAAGGALRLVQFNDTPRQEWRDSLEQGGYRVIQYYPHNAYLVWGDDAAAGAAEALTAVRWQGIVSPDWKLAPDLKGRLGLIDNVQMLVYDDGNLSNVLAQIEGLGARVLNAFDAQPDGALKSVILKIDAGQLAAVHALPQVLWSEFSGPHPIFDDELSSQIVAGNYNASNVVTAPGYIASIASLGLTGDGVVWAVTDSGIDYANPELAARIVAGHDFPTCPVTANQPGNDNANGGHGTHVAGIIAGAGVVAGGVDANGFHYGIGIAPQADLVALNPICVGGVPWPPAGGWQENSKQAILRNAVGTNNSWTSAEGTNIGYNATARQHDFMVRDGNFDTPTVNDQFMIVFSAGNSGPGASTLTSPKEAKSPIIVAATRNQRVGSIEDLASFSSRGPAVDGRVLPTIGAPGEQIASTRRVAGASQCGTAIGAAPLNNYAFCSGTSMAAPHVSGTAALLTQWWRDNNGGATPSPAMIKALLVNSAVDMSGVAQAVPNNNEGWGRIQLRNAIGEGRTTVRIDQANRLDSVAEVFERSYGVPDSGRPTRITLAWTDAPGAAGANPALVNNLDLEVIAGGQTYRGNVLSNGQSTPGGNADNRNPVENVFLPAGTGAVTVRVIATALPGDGVPNVGDATDQDFALVCSNCAAEPGFTVSMPTTLESVCGNVQIQRPITIGTILGFVNPVTMSSTGLPAPGTVGFSPNPITPPGTTTMTVNTSGVAAGEYTVLATGTSGAIVRSSSFPMFLATQAPAASTLATPANSATNVPPTIQFTWGAAAQAFDYVVQIATDAAFTNIVRTTTTRGTSWTPSPALDTNTAYFWRVISRNACPNVVELFTDGFEGGGASGGGVASATGSFTTQAAPGDCPAGPVPTIVASEDFEGAATGWVQQVGGTGSNTWAITTAFPFAGTKALQGLTPATASDQRFISPTFALPTVGNGLTLSFQSRQLMESRAGGCWDGGFIEVSTDGGTTYTQITAGLLTDPYNGPIGANNPATPAPAWCGDPQAYLKSVIDLAPYAGQSVRFRLRVTSDTSVSRVEGWNIDNVEIKRCN